MPQICDYLKLAHANDFSLLDVETVDKCLKQMSKCKAPGVDDVEVEHAAFAVSPSYCCSIVVCVV